MPVDLADLLDPATTALVLQECQKGVIGSESPLPDIAAAAAPIIPNIAAIARAAREVGVAVVHGIGERRFDGRGANSNARIFRYMARTPMPLTSGSPAAEVIDEVGVEPGDFLLPRIHGLSPFQGTELDSILRNLGVTTVVAVGVSVNVAIQNLVFDAVNAGYTVVVPTDAVAGVPLDYAAAVLEHTLDVVATLTTTQEILALWPAKKKG